MAAWLSGIFLVVAFIIISKILGVIKNSSQVFVISKQAVATMQDQTIDDLVKEKAIQRDAIELFKLFFLITAGSAVALAVPFAIIYGISLLGVVSLQAVIDLSLSWEFLGLILVATVLYFVMKRQKSKLKP